MAARGHAGARRRHGRRQHVLHVVAAANGNLAGAGISSLPSSISFAVARLRAGRTSRLPLNHSTARRGVGGVGRRTRDLRR